MSTRFGRGGDDLRAGLIYRSVVGTRIIRRLMAKPDLFIVGAPKSGTTSLYEYLSGHPQMYMSPVKEPLYFCPDVRGWRGPPPLAYPADEERYLDLFRDTRGARHIGEATTRYLVSHEAAGLVHQFQPDARAIVMLRTPVDLVHALHNERVSQGHEPLLDFAAAMAADADRAAGRQLPGEANALGAVYRESALFAAALQRWIDALGRDRVHVIVFDDLVHDSASVLRAVLGFLAVDTDYAPSSLSARNASHRQRTWMRRLVESRAGTWLSDDVAGALLGRHRRARLAHRFRQSRLNRRKVARPPIPSELRIRLEEEFRPDVVATGELIGRDLVELWFGGPS